MEPSTARVIEDAERSIAGRRQAGDIRGALEEARTACDLLHDLQRDDLNVKFLPMLLDEARFAGAVELTAYGYVALVRNILATGNPICIDVLLDGREWLARCDDEHARVALEFARSAPQVIEHLASRTTAKYRAVRASVHS